MTKRLRTVQDVIDEFGGPAEMGRLLKVSPQRINNWRVRGNFPPETYLWLTEELKRRGKSAPATLWSMTESQSA